VCRPDARSGAPPAPPRPELIGSPPSRSLAFRQTWPRPMSAGRSSCGDSVDIESSRTGAGGSAPSQRRAAPGCRPRYQRAEPADLGGTIGLAQTEISPRRFGVRRAWDRSRTSAALTLRSKAPRSSWLLWPEHSGSRSAKPGTRVGAQRALRYVTTAGLCTQGKPARVSDTPGGFTKRSRAAGVRCPLETRLRTMASLRRRQGLT
jgi:hypothetical protein